MSIEGGTTMDGQRRIPVGVLGATGAVGQRFVQLLDGHPWFELAEVAGSESIISLPKWVLSKKSMAVR